MFINEWNKKLATLVSYLTFSDWSILIKQEQEIIVKGKWCHMIKQLTSRNITITSEQQEVDRNPLPNIHFLLYTNSFYSHWSICKYQRKKNVYIGRKRKIEQRTTQHDSSNQHPTVSLSLSLFLPFLFYVTKKMHTQSDITHTFPIRRFTPQESWHIIWKEKVHFFLHLFFIGRYYFSHVFS